MMRMMMGRRTVRMMSVSSMRVRMAVRRMAVRMVHQGERIVAVRSRRNGRRNSSSCIGRGRLAAVGSRRRRGGGCVVVVHDW